MSQPTSSAAHQETHPPVTLPSWTIYRVDVRIGKIGHPSVRLNIPRYTPLPFAGTPRVMYDGVASAGFDAIFQLGAGVDARGPGVCSPTRANCKAIKLRVGSVEKLVFTDTAGKIRTLLLRPVRIAARVTHVKSAELAALARHSVDGVCELKLGEPSTHLDLGSSPTTSVSACRAAHGLVPFPGADMNVSEA